MFQLDQWRLNKNSMHFVLCLLTCVHMRIIGVVCHMLNAEQARPPRSHYFDPSFSVKLELDFFNAYLIIFNWILCVKP